MENIYILEAVFQAKRTIRSLPQWHGARWSAWFRFACKIIGRPLQDILLGLVPLRNGNRPVLQDEIIALRILLGDRGLPYLEALGRSLLTLDSHGEFSRATLELLFWRDVLSEKAYAPLHSPSQPEPLTSAAFSAEILLLQNLDSWRLDFFVPLRLKLPAWEKRQGREVNAFCAAEFFNSHKAAAYLASKIRFIEDCPPLDNSAASLLPETCDLAWKDMRYSESRQIALGGVAGHLSFRSPPNQELATRLVLGQYLGAGKNPLFGLGYWQIPELSENRNHFSGRRTHEI